MDGFLGSKDEAAMVGPAVRVCCRAGRSHVGQEAVQVLQKALQCRSDLFVAMQYPVALAVDGRQGGVCSVCRRPVCRRSHHPARQAGHAQPLQQRRSGWLRSCPVRSRAGNGAGGPAVPGLRPAGARAALRNSQTALRSCAGFSGMLLSSPRTPPGAATSSNSSCNHGVAVRAGSWQWPSIRPMSSSKLATRAQISAVLPMATLDDQSGAWAAL